MAGATDIVLGWGQGSAVTELGGTLEVDDLADGGSRVVYVDHSTTPLALPASPSFSLTLGDVTGLTLTVLARGVDDTATYRTTDGDGFLLRIDVAADAGGTDKGRGTATADWNIVWLRRGVAE
jgi:hypothetical protein